MNFNNIPAAMKALPQWSCYRLKWDENENKFRKIIISPVTGKFAYCNNPDTWTDFDSAKQYCEKYKFQGLVFALTSGIVFIDIDHAIDKDTGKILSENAAELLKLLPDTFAEISVSGTGLHILVRGNLPENALKRNDSKGLEMYDTKRFICMTGDLLNDSVTLADYSDRIAAINREFIGERKVQLRPSRHIPCEQSDEGLIERITKSKQGAKFQRLYNGDTSDYQSHSNADFALAAILVWWTRDAAQIDRIIRSSGLMRDKWDRRTGDTTYGANLIANALGLQPAQKTTNSEM